MPSGIKAKKEAIAEAIENNVRKKIIEEFLLLFVIAISPQSLISRLPIRTVPVIIR